MDESWAPAEAVSFPLADGAWIVVRGSLDRDQVERIRDAVLACARPGRVVIDVRNAEFVGAAAIGLLCEASAAAGGRLIVVGPPSVRRLIALCGAQEVGLEAWDDADLLLQVIDRHPVAVPTLPPVPLASVGVGHAPPRGSDPSAELLVTHQILRARFQTLDAMRKQVVAQSVRLRGAG